MSDSHDFAAGQLRAFIERIERLEEEIRDLNSDKSETYKEAKGTGFDVKILRKVVAARRMDSAEREEVDTLFDLYMAALGETPKSLVRARVEKIEEFDPETGELKSGPQTDELTDEAAATSRTASASERVESVDETVSQLPTSSAGQLADESPRTNHQSPQPTSSPAMATAETVPTPVSATLPDADAPAFLREEKRVLNPRCERPKDCKHAYNPHQITCATCSTSWAIAQSKAKARALA